MTKPRRPRPAGAVKPRRAPSVPLVSPVAPAAAPGAPLGASPPPALGISGIRWALLFLGGFWLVALFHIPTPDKLAPVILILFFWALIYLYYRLCCRWPIAGSLLGSFIMGFMGGRRGYRRRW